MIPINIFLTVISPYTAFLPMIFAAVYIVRKGDIVYKNPWNTGLLFLFIWSVLVGIMNKNPVSITASLALLFYLSVSVYLQNYYNEEYEIEKLLKSVIFFSIGTAFIGIAEKITAVYHEFIRWGYFFGIPSKVLAKQSYRIYSTFGNPNVAGSWYAAVILICFYFYENSSGLRRIFYGSSVFLFVIMLDLTGSRGAALGLLFGLTAYAIFKRNRENFIFLLSIFTSVVLLMFVIPELSTRITQLNNSMVHGINNSVSSRQAIWLSCLNMFKLKPLTGWGIMGIYYASSKVFPYYSRTFHGHNIWISIATTLGIVGLCAYIYMKYYLYQSIKQLYTQHCKLVPLLIGIQAAVIGQGLVDFTMMTPQGGIIFFGCSALISGLSMQYSRSYDSFSIGTLLGKRRPVKLNL